MDLNDRTDLGKSYLCVVVVGLGLEECVDLGFRILEKRVWVCQL